MKISAERQASNVRIAEVRVQVVRAIGLVLDEHPNLTHEEVLAGLLIVAGRHVDHLREDDEEVT